MFCDRIDNDSGYDNAKLAKDLIAMIPDTTFNKVASSQPIISESDSERRLIQCDRIRCDNTRTPNIMYCGVCKDFCLVSDER